MPACSNQPNLVLIYENTPKHPLGEKGMLCFPDHCFPWWQVSHSKLYPQLCLWDFTEGFVWVREGREYSHMQKHTTHESTWGSLGSPPQLLLSLFAGCSLEKGLWPICSTYVGINFEHSHRSVGSADPPLTSSQIPLHADLIGARAATECCSVTGQEGQGLGFAAGSPRTPGIPSLLP